MGTLVKTMFHEGKRVYPGLARMVFAKIMNSRKASFHIEFMSISVMAQEELLVQVD